MINIKTKAPYFVGCIKAVIFGLTYLFISRLLGKISMFDLLAFRFLFAVIAGAAMSVQGVMNTRLQENVGLWEANAFVQGTAFVLSLIVLWIFGKGSLRSLTAAPWWNLLGGALGLVITVTVMLAIKGLNPTIAISAILIAQLLVAAAIDYFGWMGQEKMSFDWRQWTGVGLMLTGVLFMKWR